MGVVGRDGLSCIKGKSIIPVSREYYRSIYLHVGYKIIIKFMYVESQLSEGVQWRGSLLPPVLGNVGGRVE